MANKIYKNGSLSFVIDAYNQSVYDSRIIFSTQDVGTARLVFKLRKDGMPLPLSAVEGKLVLLFSNGSKHIRNISLLDKVEGIAEYILNDEEIKLYGNVQASLNLFYSNGQSLSVHEFTFSVKKNLIDENIVPAAEYYIDQFDSLKSKIEQKAAELETDISKRTDEMQGNIDKSTKDLQVQLDRMKEKLEDLDSLETKKGAQIKVDTALAAAEKYTDEHAADQKKHVTEADKEKWNAAQLAKITLDNGRVFYKGSAEVTDYNTITQSGMYLIYNAGLNGPPSFNRVFLLVMSYGNTLTQVAYESVAGKQVYFRFRKADAETWTAWERQLTATDLDVTWQKPTLQPSWKQYAPADGSIHTVRFSKDASGVVEIKGAVHGGVLGLDTPVFTLPAGYRPMQSEYFVGIASSIGTPGVPQYHRTFIGTDGRVCIQSSSNTSNPVEFLSFGFRFRTR
ncbi:BppU family phage baseplate upper protein [Bacillus altitudinis]|uniref:BppU family phage baseplate upper protein n=1 Tax=Bacillus altitudinis TaxID=293387 RepID=UPI002D793CC5|nr:BppU family phage baseplate upper protein [Bacillus altitudinis]WRO24354.1 BppU family phage baseplate upper protein [Bacillus altitudinis]